MAFVRPILRTALDRSGDPVAALELVNSILVNERRTGLFVTVLAGVLNLDTGGFEFANAGHEMPLVSPPDGSEPRSILGGGPLLGVFGRLDLTLERCEIRPGERLILYTDGITDAQSSTGERFGTTRLLSTIAQSCFGGTASDTSRAVIQSVLGFQGAASPADDLALVVFRRLPA